MMWAFLAVIAAMGLALVKVRRQRKIRESRGSQAAAAYSVRARRIARASAARYALECVVDQVRGSRG